MSSLIVQAAARVKAMLQSGNWHTWQARFRNGRPMVWFELECGP
jgi:hypothetical protein